MNGDQSPRTPDAPMEFAPDELDAILRDLQDAWSMLASVAMTVPGAAKIVGIRNVLPDTVRMIFEQAKARRLTATTLWPDGMPRKLPIETRIEQALERIRNGQAPMRIPADETDPDWVLADCLTILRASVSEIEPHFRAPYPLPRDLVEVLTEYDPIAHKLEGHPDGYEADFVIRAADYRVLRDFIGALKRVGAPTIITDPARPA